MTIELSQTIVPARDKEKSARFFVGIVGLPYKSISGHCAPVRVNDRLTLDLDEDDLFESYHYAVHVSDYEFVCHFSAGAAGRPGVRQPSVGCGERNLNDWNGGRGRYFRDPNGHLLELLTGP